jgi:drug/metabolite transporter (DMT)-like permease
MTDWLPLTLLSAFSLATADAMSKRFLHPYRAREIVIVRFAVTGLLLAPLLLAQPLPPLPLPFWGWVGALLPVEILAMLCYMTAIRDSPLALTLPYLAFTPVFTTLTGYVLLDERVSASGLAGILLVVAGAWLLNIEHLRTAQRNAWAAPLRAMLNQRGAQLMLIVAGLYSLSSVMGKGAMQYAPPVFFGPFYFCVLGVVTVALFSLREPAIGRVIWRRPVHHLLIGTAMAVMVMAHFLAIRQVEVAYMIAVKRTSLLFGIAYGAALFGETRVLAHLLAGGLMVTGVAFIAVQPF